MRKVRVLVVDQSRTLQLVIAGVLAEDPEILVVGTAATAAEAGLRFAEGRIDVVAFDLDRSGTGGLAYLAELRGRAVPSVALATRAGRGEPVRDEALRRGAAGCFPKLKMVAEAHKFRELIKAAGRREPTLSGRDAALAGADRHDRSRSPAPGMLPAR